MNPRPRLNGPLAWSAASLLVVIVLVVMTLPPLARAALGPDLTGEGVEDLFARLMEEHTETADVYRERFDGRSVFFKPPRKLPTRPPVRRPVDNKPPPPPPPPPPPEEPKRPPYAGPSIGGIIGDRVYFDGDLRVSVGEERNGLEVISVDPPWGATVKYRDWEYELPLFEHDEFFEDEAEDREATLSGFIEGDEAVETAGADDEDAGMTAPARSAENAVVPAGSTRSNSRNRAKPVVDE